MPNGEDNSGDMGALTQLLAQTRTSRDQLFADAMKRLRDDRVGPTSAERLFAISKALSRPTRTGSFFEELGNVGGVLGEQEAEKRKAQMERAAMLEKYGFGQSDATIAGLESQINMRMKMQAAEDARVKAEAAANKRRTALSAYDGRVYDLDTGEVVEPLSNLPVYTPEQAAAAKAAIGGGPLRFQTIDGRDLEI